MFHSDGMPASKSTNSQFWTILSLLQLEGNKPFEIVVYLGILKPDHPNNYLNHFHSEISGLIENGFITRTISLELSLFNFVATHPLKISPKDLNLVVRTIWLH